MSDEFLKDRRSALEESFFAKENQKLLDELRQKHTSQAQKQALGQASGIKNAAVLDSLVDLKISAETLTALSLVPLVVVAWADGQMDEKERKAILKAADESEVPIDPVARQLLVAWLETRPSDALLGAWKAYIGELSQILSVDANDSLRDEVMGRARDVAQSAGGFLGIGTVSEDEERILNELEAAFGSV